MRIQEEAKRKAEAYKAELKAIEELERLQFDEFKEENILEINNLQNPKIEIENIICPICEQTLDFDNLDNHECKCIYCTNSFPSDLLSFHHDVCPRNISIINNRNNHININIRNDINIHNNHRKYKKIDKRTDSIFADNEI